MTRERLPEAADERLSFGSLLVVLVLIVCASSTRRRAAGGIRVASPSFVPLPPDAARRVADELGAAFGALLDAE